MGQHLAPDNWQIPVTDPARVVQDLSELVIDGVLDDSDLLRRIEMLARNYDRYLVNYGQGLWASGLVVDNNMRALTEWHLPLAEVRQAFYRLLRCALRQPPFLEATPFARALSWLDVLPRLDPACQIVNPATLLKKLMLDQSLRLRFLFALFIPRHYGGGYCRYPRQSALVRKWLAERQGQAAGGLRCLDAGCGSGEGTYGLARLIQESGYTSESFVVYGSTREPVELFAAVHGYFPHDPGRQGEARRQIELLRANGGLASIRFRQADLLVSGEHGRFDLIFCNGLVGGPLLHQHGQLVRAAGNLAAGLNPGGMLLMADRFHAGWKKLVPATLIEHYLREAGLRPVPIKEGVAAVKA